MNDKLFVPLHRTALPADLAHGLAAQCGIVTQAQLYEALVEHAAALAALLGLTADQLKSRVFAALGEPPAGLCQGGPILVPPCGVTLQPSESQKLTGLQRSMLARGQNLADLAKKLGDLPPKADLTSSLGPVLSQGAHGYCVGFGSTATREYSSRKLSLSPGYAYRGAKTLDDMPDKEGTWLNFAYEFFYKTGHVTANDYSYDDAINNRPIGPLAKKAKPLRIDAYLDFTLECNAFEVMPTILKAVLSGRLLPQLGPQPVGIGVAVFKSVWATHSAHRSGLLTLPLPGEACCGGHAMALVGYSDANSNDFGRNFFIARNSYGTEFASENPLGYPPGHAVIPEEYFTSRKLLWGAILGLAEASPLQGSGIKSSMLGSLWRVTKSLM